MIDRKHPTAAFWITVALVVVLVGYPLSIGPAWWMTCKMGHSKRMNATFDTIYAPVLLANENGPGWLHQAIWWYVTLWLPRR
jgi:hypothetical protein